MGSKGSQTTNTSQNQTYVPAGGGYLANALNSAQSLAQQGVPTIPTAPVAGFSGQQQQAFNLAGNTGIQNPYLSAASNLFSPSGIQNYYNPAVNSVTAQMQNIFGQQQSQNNANLVNAAGGVGADRIAVGQGNLANQQALAAGQTYAGLWNSAAQQAQSAAYGTAGLGAQAQAANTQDVQNLLGTGGLQQQLSQAQLNAPYQQQLAQLALPYQLQQFYTQNIGALAPALGGTTYGQGTSTTSFSPSLFSTLGGLGAIGLGAFGKGTGGSVPYARGGRSNPYCFDEGGAAPIDVSQGLFAGNRLFRLPDQAPPPAQAHVPQLNLNMQAPNLMQQQGMGNLQSMTQFGRSLNKTSFGDALQDFSQDLFEAHGGRIYARGGAPNPYANLPHFDDGGGDSGGGDGGGDPGGDPGGGGSVGDGGGGIGSDAGAAGEGSLGGLSGAPGIGSDTGAMSASMSAALGDTGSTGVSEGLATAQAPGPAGSPNDAEAAGAATAAQAALGEQAAMAEAGLTAPGAALGNFGTAMGTGLADTDSVGAFGPGNLNAMTGLPSLDEGIAGFGPNSVSGPAGVGLGFGTAAAGLGLGNMTSPGMATDTTAIADETSPPDSSVAPSLTANQAVSGAFGALNSSPAVGALNSNLGQVAANLGPPGTTATSPNAVAAALSGIPGALSTAGTGVNGAVGAGLTGVANAIGTAPAETAAPAMSFADPTTSPAASQAALGNLAAVAQDGSLGNVAGSYGGGYGGMPLTQYADLLSNTPYGFVPHIPQGFAKAARGGVQNPYCFDDGGDVALDDETPLDRTYQGLSDLGVQRGQIDAAAQQAGPAVAAAEERASAAQPLHAAIGRLETSGRGINGPNGRFANELYQQYPAFAKQYGVGESGINNYARQVLKANPNATFGDLYGGYVTGTGDPAAARMQNLLMTTQPGARGAYANLMRNSPIDPNTPLSSLIGGTGQGPMAYAADNTNPPYATMDRIAKGLPPAIAQGPGPGPGAQSASLQAPGAGPTAGLPGQVPDDGQHIPMDITPPPPGAGTAGGGKGSGTLFGKQGYLNTMMHDPARMALIMGGMSMMAGQGFGSGFGQGVQLQLHQQSADLAAKRLEQEANFHADAMKNAARPYEEMTAAQKAGNERAQAQLEEQKRVHEFQMSRPVPFNAGYDQYGQPLHGVLIPERQPDGSFKWTPQSQEQPQTKGAPDSSFKIPGQQGAAATTAQEPEREGEGAIPANARLVSGGPYDFTKGAPDIDKGMEVPEPQPVADKSVSTLKADAGNYILTGTLPPVRGTRGQVAFEAQQYQNAVKNYGNAILDSRGIKPEDRADFWRASKGYQRYVTGPDGRSVVAIGNVMRHTEILSEIAKEWNAGNFTPSNALKAKIASMFGKDAATNLEVAARIVAPETMKALGAVGAGGIGERTEVKEGFSPHASLKQIMGAVQVTQRLLGEQAEGKEGQAALSGVDHDHFKKLLGEKPYEILENLKKQPIGGAETQPAAGGFTPPTGAVARKDKSGKTWYFDPNSRQPYPGQ